jgi:predicted nucleotide-binding protein
MGVGKDKGPADMKGIAEKINDLVDVGWNVTNQALYDSWNRRVRSFLRVVVSDDLVERFNVLGLAASWKDARDGQIGMLEGLALKEAQDEPAADGSRSSFQVALPPKQSKRVFVVHGRDTEVKESVARFLERLALEPIILHEQPNSGRTVIEKFELHADVGFAVVLLTPDDVGGLDVTPANLKGRARQNVILELGYFLGRLSRRRVCALYKNNVEIPSDYQGVLFVEFDPSGAWRTKLAQELVEAGFSISLDALLKS